VTPASPAISQRGPGRSFLFLGVRGCDGPGCDASLGPAQFSWRLPRPRTPPPPGACPGGGAVWLLLFPVLSVDQPTALVVPLLSPIGAVPAHRDQQEQYDAAGHRDPRDPPAGALGSPGLLAVVGHHSSAAEDDLQRGAPAVSDWCVAIGGDSGPYARAHPNIGLGVDQDRAVQEEQDGTNARRALRRLKPSRFDRESGSTASPSMSPLLPQVEAAESNLLPVKAASRPCGMA
jgi:hypothetical protein